jgi:riboflavin synthase
MFTGIIESTGTIEQVTQEGSNYIFEISCPFTAELIIGQSVAHDGVCLTVTSIQNKTYNVTAIDETLKKTSLGQWKKGQRVNLERCMPANGRFDGHIVQGHVDTTAICKDIKNENGSFVFSFGFSDDKNKNLLVEKGSVCINGVSLTVVSCNDKNFSVAIIPHTMEVTGFGSLKTGDTVNIEFDIIGKYVSKLVRNDK